MHITGKILVWISLPIAVAGFIFAARLVDVRGRWMQQVQDLKSRNQKVADELAAARLERDEAHLAVNREILRWDRIWTDVVAQYNDQTKTLVTNAPTPKIIPQGSTLYAFQTPKKKEPSYVGSFVLAQAQPNLCVLRPTFRVRDEDVPNWNAAEWRFRTMIPASYVTRIGGLEGELLHADELLAKQEANLATQKKLVDAARQQREERLAELLGNANANPPSPGLVVETTEADDRRNVSLVEVDRLRREISAANKRVAQLLQENTELARTLQAQSVPKQTAMADPAP